MFPFFKKQKKPVTVVFQASKKATSKAPTKNAFAEINVIKPGIGERILCTQRRHKIALFNSLTQNVLILISLLILLLFVALAVERKFPFINESAIIILYITLFIICAFTISFVYIFLYWYYEFFVITNRSIIHRFCFRIAGPYSDIVYAGKMNVREIVRRPSNLVYDLLKIEDVRVYFRKIEREAPFIFKTPSDSQEIEDLLHDLSIVQKQHKKIYD